MKIPRDLSGADLIKILCSKWDYKKVHQAGSHIVLETENPVHHRIAVPNHHCLRIGTLNGILRAVARTKNIDKKDVLI